MMNYFAGDWKLTGTTKISPSTPGSPFTSTEHGEWVPGGFFLEIHSVMKGPLGDVHGVRMMEYNAADTSTPTTPTTAWANIRWPSARPKATPGHGMRKRK